jgi:sugar transferase (PEP-CTERM/EpsH1 system associated)
MRILFLTHRLPYAPNRGDRIRAFHILRELSGRHEVRVVSLVHDEAEQREVAGLHRFVAGAEARRVPRWRNLARVPLALPGRTPLTHVLLNAGLGRLLTTHVKRHPPDVVLAYCSGMARLALEPPLRGIPFVLDMVDVDSEKWRALGRKTGGPRGWIYRREADRLARFERDATRQAYATTVVNERERSSLLALAPDADIRVVPIGVDTAAYRAEGPPSDEPRVVFTGVFNYRPNEDGAIWLAERVWPLVTRRHPGALLTLVGANPTPAVKRLAAADSSIHVTGTVPRVQPFLWQAALAVVPLATARGIQTKVLEAIAAGIPVVVTPVVQEGLPSAVAPACTVANEPEAFASAIIGLLQKYPAERRAIAQAADLSSLGWEAQLSPLVALLEELADRTATPRAATRPLH